MRPERPQQRVVRDHARPCSPIARTLAMKVMWRDIEGYCDLTSILIQAINWAAPENILNREKTGSRDTILGFLK